MDGAGVEGTCLAAVLEEKEKTPALAVGAVHGSAGAGSACLAAVLEGEKGRAPALAMGGGAWRV